MLPRNSLRPSVGQSVLSVAAAAGLLLAASGASFTPQAGRASDDQAQRLEATAFVASPPRIETPVVREAALSVPDRPAEPGSDREAEAATVAAPEGAIAGSHPPVAVWQPASHESEPLRAAEPVAQSFAVEPQEPAAPAVVPRAASIQRPSAPVAPKVVSSAFTSRVLGKWVPDREACTDPGGSEYLPLRISAVEASTGEAACRFLSQARHGQAWDVAAECSDGSSQWNAKVNLAVAAGQLTWSSERGVQTYVRCEETRVAKRATREQFASRHAKARSKVAARKAPAVRVIGGASTPKTWALLKVR